MICNQIFCVMALVFLVSMTYMAIAVDKNISTKMIPYLTPEQVVMYQQIQDERKKNHMYGLVGGLVLSIILILASKYLLKTPLKVNLMCFMVTVSYITMYFYYNMTSKTDLLIVHLNTKDARLQWQKYYKYMKYQYNISLLLGIIFVVLLNFTTCK
jgi:hypothetical protein